MEAELPQIKRRHVHDVDWSASRHVSRGFVDLGFSDEGHVNTRKELFTVHC